MKSLKIHVSHDGVLEKTIDHYILIRNKFFDLFGKHNICNIENISVIENTQRQREMEMIQKLNDFLDSVYPKDLDSSMPFHNMVLLSLLIAAICWILSIVSIEAFRLKQKKSLSYLSSAI